MSDTSTNRCLLCGRTQGEDPGDCFGGQGSVSCRRRCLSNLLDAMSDEQHGMSMETFAAVRALAVALEADAVVDALDASFYLQGGRIFRHSP